MFYAPKLARCCKPITSNIFSRSLRRRFSSSNLDCSLLFQLLHQIEDGSISAKDAEKEIQDKLLQKIIHGRENLSIKSPITSTVPNEDTLSSFANLDHDRTLRTGFPEAVFAAGKTPQQISTILNDMAGNVNKLVNDSNVNGDIIKGSQKAILATRVNPELFQEVAKIKMENGQITYYEMAKIISMRASALEEYPTEENSNGKIVVACAGTTDLPVAEEAAVTLEAAGCEVDRVYDVGVAGLHRIINALPRLRCRSVDGVIVCAGMDGALPSVVAGLVDVPVIAVPTSVGYGASFGGISAMLTMLNSCAPGVGVVNIDNGFGGAALAFKCIKKSKS